MFTNYTWRQILQHIRYLPSNSSGDHLIFIPPKNLLNYVRISREQIFVATKEEPDNFVEIPPKYFEAVYNELVYLKKLPHKNCPNIMNIKFAGIVIAILGQLPEVYFDKKKGTLTYIRVKE